MRLSEEPLWLSPSLFPNHAMRNEIVVTAFISTAVTSAKKHKQDQVLQHLRDQDDIMSWSTNKYIDLRGRLRQSFFVDSALTAPNENTVCSPLSVMMPLGKLALGAEGSTLEELLSAIGIPRKSMIKDIFNPMVALLHHLPGGKLDIASKIYVSINSRLQQNFIDESKAIFDYTVEKIDFGFPTYAAQQINSWVSFQTNGIIKNIITPAEILPSTSLILVNAVYFSGKWNEAFENFDNVTFYGPNSHKVLTMMSNRGFYNYTNSKALDAEIIKIPYKTYSEEFVIILPTNRYGLPLLIKQLKLSPEILDTAMSELTPMLVELTMPKFKIETELNMKDMYELLGVNQMFEQTRSQLTKIVKDETVYVTTAKHKAFIDVHEFGTEAGAASATAVWTSAQLKTIIFQADHPFLFFILVKGQQLFSGTYVNPTTVEPR